MQEVHRVAECMREYQRIHGIKGKCVDNTQFLSDSLPMSKTVPCIVIGEYYFTVHLVVMYGDELIDPSYDTYSYSDKYYYMSIAEFRREIEIKPEKLRWLIKKFVSLAKIARDRHDNNDIIITDNDYYNSLADWVQAHYMPGTKGRNANANN